MTTALEQIRLAFRGLSDEEDEESALNTGGEEFELNEEERLEDLEGLESEEE